MLPLSEDQQKTLTPLIMESTETDPKQAYDRLFPRAEAPPEGKRPKPEIGKHEFLRLWYILKSQPVPAPAPAAPEAPNVPTAENATAPDKKRNIIRPSQKPPSEIPH